MPRAVLLLGGGILGFVAGSFLTTPLIAHVYRTTVTWDATACPPGVYTITGIATSWNGSKSFGTATQTATLPQASITQDFGELPAGAYRISATVQPADPDGRTFISETVRAAGKVPIPPTPTPRAFTTQNRGRQRFPTPPTSGYYGSSVSSAISIAEPMAPPPPVEIPERHVRLSQAIRDRLSTDAGVFELLEAFPWWKSIDFVDADLDGTPETVRIEWVSGEILVAHLKDQ